MTKRTAGFTIIEMLIYMGITSSLIASCFVCSELVFDSISRSHDASSALSLGNTVLQIAEHEAMSGILPDISRIASSTGITDLRVGTQKNNGLSLTSVSFSISSHVFSTKQQTYEN